MVLNSFKVENHTGVALKFRNLRDRGDDYDIPAYKSRSHDAWLGQTRAFGCELLAQHVPTRVAADAVLAGGEDVSTKATIRIVLIWDNSWKLHVDVDGDDNNAGIDVDGNKDFHMRVYWNRVEFHCYNGVFKAGRDDGVVKFSLAARLPPYRDADNMLEASEGAPTYPQSVPPALEH
ncbi:hypothetical protein MNEG_12527 [Monoraphidium neglectum]|uniref:Uncharacterized protein n=1 Tax=Monoraphidium neglectum TaxID=145388 RepID=A0A0D2LV10_9CHLO|nr:hypothetical protein MNEG_12527 [Monoraphidium neglectum]KIY95434.1 hypothetical protein MNEG_12527 [Monoraphidium neglectum]|eukprot:XP_013894454.1 hypothetical protein MNEG_12527 [Monoraphidium neglectum]